MLSLKEILRRKTSFKATNGDLLIGLTRTYTAPEALEMNDVTYNTGLNIMRCVQYNGRVVRPLYINAKHVVHFYDVASMRAGAAEVDVFLRGAGLVQDLAETRPEVEPAAAP